MDLDSARILHDSRGYNSCAFFCQQAAEKTAKALLYSIGESPFGDSVLQLLERFAEASGKDVSELRPLGIPMRCRLEALMKTMIMKSAREREHCSTREDSWTILGGN